MAIEMKNDINDLSFLSRPHGHNMMDGANNLSMYKTSLNYFYNHKLCHLCTIIVDLSCQNFIHESLKIFQNHLSPIVLSVVRLGSWRHFRWWWVASTACRCWRWRCWTTCSHCCLNLLLPKEGAKCSWFCGLPSRCWWCGCGGCGGNEVVVLSAASTWQLCRASGCGSCRDWISPWRPGTPAGTCLFGRLLGPSNDQVEFQWMGKGK